MVKLMQPDSPPEAKNEESLAQYNERHDYWQKYLQEYIKTQPLRSNCREKVSPHAAVKALMMLEQHEPKDKIIKQCHFNFQSLSQFIARHTLTIQENRKLFSRKFAMVTEMGIDVMAKKFDMLMEDEAALAKTSPKDIAIAIGVMTDKGAQMDGMASQIVEHRNTEANVGDAFAYIQAAKERAAQKAQAIEAEIIV